MEGEVPRLSAPTPRLSGPGAQPGGPQFIGYLVILPMQAELPLWAQLWPLTGKSSLLLALLSSLYFTWSYEVPIGCLPGPS